MHQLLCYGLYCRSGKYVYKPTMNRTCCPQYPIRCDVASLRLTKSQKKVIKRVNRYLSYGERQAVTSSEPERHGREEVNTGGCQMTADDVKLQGALSSAAESGLSTDAAAAGPSGSQSTVTTSSSGCEKKVIHKTPKPGVYFVLACVYYV